MRAVQATKIAKKKPILKQSDVDKITNGMHGLGDGLWLDAKAGKAWAFRFTLPGGKPRQMGLGSADHNRSTYVTLAQAIAKREEYKALVDKGIDPIEHARREKLVEKVKEGRAKTFKEAAMACIADRKDGWRNAKHAVQWTRTLEMYAYPLIGHLPVADIETEHVAACLRPLLLGDKKAGTKPIIETGTRVRGRIEEILNYSVAMKWRPHGPNPAQWAGNIEYIFKSVKKKVEHHPALPWQDMPRFMLDLERHDGYAARALRLVILTACRSGEARLARWSEIDLDAALWIIPAERMKADREHRIPLSVPAIAVLRQMKDLDDSSGLVFPGLPNRPLSDMTLTAVLKRMGQKGITVHGFRSTFRDWCADTGKAPDIAEAALAHTLGNKTNQAYQHTTMLDRRRVLMSEWASFAMSAVSVAEHMHIIVGAKDASLASGVQPLA